MSNLHNLNRTIIIGLSGPSSSGKTTLARLLRSIFNIPPSTTTNNRSISLFIFHQDDTYKTDTEIPYTTTPSGHRFQDWDCTAAIDLPLLESTLQHIHTHSTLPPALYSKEDQNAVGDSGVPAHEIQTHRQTITSWLSTWPKLLPPPSSDSITTSVLTICILDGFLLYPDPASAPPSIPRQITDLLDVKLFIRTDCARTKKRRGARKGYVTLEGFWEDPEGYVDEVVWPNYVAEHGWMFEGGDVDEGDVLEGRVRDEEGILVAPGKGERSMGELLGWCVETIQTEIDRVLRESRG